MLFWILLIPIKCLEIFGFSYLLNFIFKSFTKTRHLSDDEIKQLRKIYGSIINFKHIRINENSKWAKIGAKKVKKTHLGFVWMNTINFSRSINCKTHNSDLSWLIHEMVHVAQFEKLGIQYIFEALLAQKYGGYDYGGKHNLINRQLKHFNLEQQAEIIKDYAKDLKQNKDTNVYKNYIKALQKLDI